MAPRPLLPVVPGRLGCDYPTHGVAGAKYSVATEPRTVKEKLEVTDRESLLRSILESPQDDTPRLIYADWLEENGEAERAEFVRVQVELARLERNEIHFADCDACALAPDTDQRARHAHDCPHAMSRRRYREIGTSLDLTNEFARQIGFDFGERSGEAAAAAGWRWERVRGFIASLACSWSDWLAHEAAILREHPVERVRLTDLRPVRFTNSFAWFHENVPPGRSSHQREEEYRAATLPAAIHESLRQYLDWRAELPTDGDHPCKRYRTFEDAVEAFNRTAAGRWPGIVFELPKASGLFINRGTIGEPDWSAIQLARGQLITLPAGMEYHPMQAALPTIDALRRFREAMLESARTAAAGFRDFAESAAPAIQAVVDAWPRDPEGNLIGMQDTPPPAEGV